MGQKVNPIGLRLGHQPHLGFALVRRQGRIRPAAARGHQHPRALMEDLKQAAVSKIVIERPHKKCRVTIHSARPGIVIGKKGADIEKLRKSVARDDRRRSAHQHRRDPQAGDRRQAGRREHRPAARAPRRLPPRDEARRAVGHAAGRRGHPHQSAPAASAAPRSPAWSGIARAACRCTRCAPTSTTASPTANTTYGTCGVKVWIFKGEIMEHDPMAHGQAPGRARPAGERRRRGDRRPPRDRAARRERRSRPCCHPSEPSSASSSRAASTAPRRPASRSISARMA